MIAERLKQAREHAGFSEASEAADRFGWARSTYLGHENGSRGIRPDVAAKYARAFRVSPEWLMFGAGAEEITPPGMAEAVLPMRMAPPPKAKPGIHISVDGATARIEATVTLDNIEEVRRKVDLIEALLKG